MEKTAIMSPEKAYEDAGRDFVKATKPIADYYWECRKQTLRDGKAKHQPVIAPTSSDSNERLYVIQSDNFPGWLQTDQRYVNEGRGIAIAKYNNIPTNSKLERFVKVVPNPIGKIDTQFMTIPDEILLITNDTFRYNRNNAKNNKNWQFVPALGLAEYPKDHIKKALVNSKKPYLDYGVEFGRLNLNDGYGSKFNGQYNHNDVGQSIFLDMEDVPFQSISWPTIVYCPNLDGDDPFAWSTYQKHYRVDDPIPKNTTYYTADIKALQQKWLAPFSAGIREVSKGEL